LQRTLYRQAKSKPQWKAWSLYGDVCRRDVLEAALRQVVANGGAPGVDGVRVKDLVQDAERREQWLTTLESDLRRKIYRPSPVRRVMIPKADGKQRPLGIPTVRDRVVQTAVVLLLLPIFEADFHEKSYAYRPKRRAQHAVAAIEVALLAGRREVVDADLSGYFDTIPHALLMRLIKGRVSDGAILRLIKGWLRAPIVEEERRRGVKRTVANRCGTPQGGVISPLLANLYLDGLDKAVNGGRQMKAVMVRYADDFVVLCRKGQGMEMQRRLTSWLERRGLKLNEKKTRVVDFEKDGLEFLGFRLSWRRSRAGKRYPHCEPSPESCGKLRAAIREETARSTQWKQPEEVFARVNQRVRGWIGYFHHANSTRVFTKMQWQVRQRMRHWLWKKHAKTKAQYGRHYCDERLHGHYGLIRFPLHAKW
jgi:RNA-directed DNA polymerase